MNYYELGKYAGYKNIPLHTLLDFKGRKDTLNYITGFIYGRDKLNKELRETGDEVMFFFESKELL
jgi:hypothetical protein